MEFEANETTLALIVLLFLSFSDDGQRILEDAAIRILRARGIL